MKKILVVAVHPDDETLMCGGTLLKHKENGDNIFWLIVTNISEDHDWIPEFVKNRQNEIEIVSKHYNFEKVIKLDFPTTKLDTIPIGNIITKISNVFNQIKPEIVYLPNSSDVHTDHQITFKAAYSCTKNFRFPFIEKVLMGETLSETEFAPRIKNNCFSPNYFVDISKHIDEKLKIMRVFSSEIMNSPFPRSFENIKALAKYRGSRAGFHYAEAFELLFERLI